MKVQILMSTYNGERYIRTQLDSIVKQTIDSKSLLIRDDGSTDNTISIIREYQKEYPWIEMYQGSNLGVQKSFFELIKKSDPNADYIAFADQDDEWLPEKLGCAVNKLEELYHKRQQPLLYCGSQIMVDEQLQPLEVTVSRFVRTPAFGNALVQNICTGCTAVINRELAELIRNNMPTNMKAIVMHDWWLYLIASCFGNVYYDDVPYIRYRQHKKNAHGAIVSKRELVKYRLRQLSKPRGEIYRQVEEFARCYKNVLNGKEEQHQSVLINKLIRSQGGIHKRICFMLDLRYFRQKIFDDIVFRGIVLINKL